MAVRWARWLDHLPLWVAWGASAATGVYEPGELALMGLPLMVAAAMEGARRDAGRYHRWLEVGALLFFLGDLARGQGLYTVAIHTLFVLAGVRLVLPREAPQRRQLLLMSFLLFLTTAIGTTDLAFLGWTLAWFGTAMLAMLHHSWEPSAALRRGALARPPYGRVPLWLGGALLLGTGFFLIMPRVGLGLRSGLLLGPRAAGQAGLGDSLDLTGGGPIAPNPEVALRVVPLGGVDPLRQPAWTLGLERLRGLTLEAVKDLRWEADDLTPPLIPAHRDKPDLPRAEFNFTPSLHGILSLPTGLATLEPPGLPIVRGTGASLRWRYVRARTRPFDVTWDPGQAAPREARLSSRRLDLLTHLEPDQACAQRASLRFAPGFQPTPQLASTLEAALRKFRYTLDNPSGQAANPLEDFLERSQAGHCEYFASAMALMLRARGVPARVVTGYRLGPWIPEGGYFRVSQNEAHSWAEYWYEGRWWTSDPTPAGEAASGADLLRLGSLERWLDALRYRWDRYVVRYSDEDQLVGLAWAQRHLQGWEYRWQAPRASTVSWLGFLVGLWLLWRFRSHWQPRPAGPWRIRALGPLLARTRESAPPQPGDTARSWLQRLAGLRPDRAAQLQRLADAVDAHTYGAGDPSASALAKAEAATWRGWKAPTSR